MLANKIILDDTEGLTNYDLHMDYTENLEHPHKIGRYLQYTRNIDGTFRSREIEVQQMPHHEGNIVAQLLAHSSLTKLEMERIIAPYLK
jgi:hypothetical protein